MGQCIQRDLERSGIEDMTIDLTAISGGIQMVNCTNCWIRGVRFVYAKSAVGQVSLLELINAFHVTLESNYFWGPSGPPQINNYQLRIQVAGSVLTQNNIFHHAISAMVPNGPMTASVFAYNFVTDSFYTGPGYIAHGMTMTNLVEGNNMSGAREDIIHAPHFFTTFFRNHLDGHKNNPDANRNSMFQLESKARFMNIVGNVLGDTDYINTYQTVYASGETSVYELGWKGDNSGSDPGNDPDVLRTLFRWGNWDTKTNAPRWCVDATAPCTASEVPSGIPTYPNAVPASQTLPASFAYASKPSWFGTVAWPPIGPDVTSGDIAGYAGHANKIPARVCFESSTVDSAYGSNNVRLFNATTCYGPLRSGAPAPASAPRIIK